MNRETKRAMDKAERSKDKVTRPTPQQAAAKRRRTGVRQFAKEVRGELARVAWPNRQEVVTYSIVVLVSVAFFMAVVGGLDYGFTKLVVKVISGA